MGITVDVAYKSLNKYTEILCGDKVELLQTADSNIMILADGMGSGVKANILSTLTSKILGTMFLNGATLEECVDTISETLPICQVRQVAYSTFSILQVYHNGDAYLVEYDNPGCIFIRDGRLMEIPRNVRVIQGKEINEYRFKVQKGDALILMSDGTIHAGVGELLNFGWLWQDIADYAVRQYPLTVSAMRLAASISRACDELYQFRPGDDTTVACMRIIDSKPVHLMTGPARNPEDDVRMVHDFMADSNAKTIVCGGTSATIVSRVLGKKLDVSLDHVLVPWQVLLYPVQKGNGIILMAGKDHVADDDALLHKGWICLLPHRGACLPYHLEDGQGGAFKVITGVGISEGQTVIIIFEVRKPDIHIIFQGQDGFNGFITAAVVDNGNGKFRPGKVQGGRDMGQVLGGCHQVYVMGALVLQVQEDAGQMSCGQLFPEVLAAEL